MYRSIRILIAFLMLVSFQAYSQSLYDGTSSLIDNYFQMNNDSGETTIISNNTTQQPTDGSIVIITQEGNYNNSYIISQSNNKQSIIQVGDNNSYEYYTYYNSMLSEINALQYGDNNDIQIFGQNELVKNISIIQKTNNQTLIIKNY